MSELFSEDIELGILGSLVMWPDELGCKINEMSAEDFHYPACRTVFSKIASVYEAGGLGVALVASGLSGSALACLKAALTYPVTSVHFGGLLMRLKDLSLHRRVKNRVADLMVSPIVTVDDLQKIVDDEKDSVFIRSYIDKSRADLQEFAENIGREKQRIKMGFPVLDKITGGLRIPSVMMLGAYPSVGKTAFALNVAARQDGGVVFFSLEMSSEMIYERLVSARAKLDYGLFSSQSFSEQQNKDIGEIVEDLKKRDLYVFDDIYDVEGHSAVVSSIKPKLVIVDYIQKVKTSQKADGRRVEIDYISGMYKQIAKHNKCAVMLLSQISRVDRNEPSMASLKESGALEADGDYVGILHRPYVLKKGDPDITPEKAYILIDKNKFGNTGKLDLRFEGRYQQFYEIEKDRETAAPKGSAVYRDGAFVGSGVPVEDDELPFI